MVETDSNGMAGRAFLKDDRLGFKTAKPKRGPKPIDSTRDLSRAYAALVRIFARKAIKR